MDIINEDVMQLTLEPTKSGVKTNRSANVVIGAMITAIARCYIYRAKMKLDSAGFKTFYVDTDSLIYRFCSLASCSFRSI